MTQTKKKSEKLYHSALAKQGRTRLRFKSDPLDGRFGPYCFVQLPNEADDRLFSIDSDAVKAEIERTRANVGDGWVEVTAAGTKDSSTILVEQPGTNGPTFPGDEPVRQPQNAPPPMWPEAQGPYPPQVDQPQGNGDATRHPRELVVDTAADLTVRAVQRLEKAGIRVDSDAAARIFNTLYIQSAR